MPEHEDIIDRIIDIAAGQGELESDDVEQRGTRRQDFDASLALVQWTPTGGKSIATVVQAKNISARGICVVSRYMLHVGHEGVILMSRSNGDPAMLGVKVVHCAYVGDMKHESGLAFIAIPEHFALDDFRDEHGHLPDIGLRRAA